MQEKYKLSVIVPVYNAEKYLEASINSILNQTLKDIEIILVNDGSTDGSLSICRRFEEKDTRIRVIDKANGGVSSARNIGIKFSSGEFIGFIDPDDWIEPEMYSSMYEKAKHKNVNVVMCNYVNQYKNKSIHSKINIQDTIINRKIIINELIANMISGETLNSNSTTIAGTVWRMLIKRELIVNNNIKFNEDIPLMEDLIFTIEVLLNTDRIVIDKNHLYHYVHHDNTAGRKYRYDYIDISQKVFDNINKILVENNVMDSLKIRMDYRYINMKLLCIANEARKENPKKLNQKVAVISAICNDLRIKSVLNQINYTKYTIRKKFVLQSLKKNRIRFLLGYFSLLDRI